MLTEQILRGQAALPVGGGDFDVDVDVVRELRFALREFCLNGEEQVEKEWRYLLTEEQRLTRSLW